MGDHIVALQGFSRMSNMDIVFRGTALVDGVDGNPRFRESPVKLPELRDDLTLLKALTSAALDGSKKIIAQRDAQREKVISQLRMLVRYVEITSGNDMETFKSSSLEPAYQNRRAQATWSECIRRIDRAESGTLLVFINDDPKAASYELRYAPAGTDPASDLWTTIPISHVKSAVKITGLTPARAYAFQVRRLQGREYTDWSDPITFICT